jgi:hypothetical protein
MNVLIKQRCRIFAVLFPAIFLPMAHGQALYETLLLLPPPSAVVDGDCPADLAHSWKGNSSLADAQGGIDLTAGFGVNYGGGKVGNGFSFDGSTFVRLDAADSASLSMGAGVAKSVSLWVKFNGMTAFQYLFFKGDYGGGNEEWECYLNATSNIVFQVYKPGGEAQQVISTVQLASGTTNHLAFTYDGAGAAVLYVNGTSTAATFQDGTNTTAGLFVGMNNGGNGRLNGVLDEFQIYTRSLSSGEVATLRNNDAGRSCP